MRAKFHLLHLLLIILTNSEMRRRKKEEEKKRDDNYQERKGTQIYCYDRGSLALFDVKSVSRRSDLSSCGQPNPCLDSALPANWELVIL